MSAATSIPISEYLSTSYRPDREYVDGALLERNVGEYSHSRTQGRLLVFFSLREREWGIIPLVEQRVQVKPRRFRVPDLCVLRSRPQGGIVDAPPLLCVEILSPEDRVSEMQERIDDYLAFGVPHVWVIDPERRKGWIHAAGSSHPVTDGVLRAEEMAVSLAEIFE